MYRLKRNGHESVNFEMVFEEYIKLMEQGNSNDKRSKAAALRAFERLIGSSLISYVDPRQVLLFLPCLGWLVRPERWANADLPYGKS